MNETINSILKLAVSIEKADKIERLGGGLDNLVQTMVAELTLLCLDTSDSIDEGKISFGSPVITSEVSASLKQIAFHALEIQGGTEGNHAKQIKTFAVTVSKLLNIPLPEPDESIKQAEDYSADNEDVPVLRLADNETSPTSVTEGFTLWKSGGEGEVPPDQEELLRREIKALRARLTELLVELDELKQVVCVRLQAEYMVKLGNLEAEIYYAESELRVLQKKIRTLQAYLNRQEKADTEKIEQDVSEKYKEFRAKYDAYVNERKKAEEKEQRREKAEKEWEEKQREKKKSAEGESTDTGKNGKEDGNRTDGGEKADSTSGSNEQNSGGESDSGSKEEPEMTFKQRLKYLYRKIVKAMHPDRNPNQTKAEAELFKKAQVAYEEEDIDVLERIAATIDGAADRTEEADRSKMLEALLREKMRLMLLVRSVSAQIENIKNSFPYKYKELLENPVLLAEKQTELRKRLDDVRLQREAAERHYEELKKKNDK